MSSVNNNVSNVTNPSVKKKCDKKQEQAALDNTAKTVTPGTPPNQSQTSATVNNTSDPNKAQPTLLTTSGLGNDGNGTMA